MHWQHPRYEEDIHSGSGRCPSLTNFVGKERTSYLHANICHDGLEINPRERERGRKRWRNSDDLYLG
jgi:hypothetical protein